ncbi:mCG51731 [Mus musculus]|jgi:small subunit ribosomal protein S2e|nr:mCG51731 [Mus musculus]
MRSTYSPCPLRNFRLLIFFPLGTSLNDEVLKIMPVRKQTWAGQGTRFKALVTISDYDDHTGLGVKYSTEVPMPSEEPQSWPSFPSSLCREATGEHDWQAPRCPMQGHRSQWLCAGTSQSHPCPTGTGIVSASVLKKLLMIPSIDDCYTSARGYTATLGNFAKATFDVISKTYSYLTPNL